MFYDHTHLQKETRSHFLSRYLAVTEQICMRVCVLCLRCTLGGDWCGVRDDDVVCVCVRTYVCMYAMGEQALPVGA